MKNNTTLFFITLLFLLVTAGLQAQQTTELECGTLSTPESQEYWRNTKKTIKKYEKEFYELAANESRTSIINSVPIKAHIIRKTDGTGGLTEAELNDAMDNMNAFYASAFMEFFLCDGINYIDDDNYYDFKNSEDEASLTLANNVNGLINIYFTNYIENSSGSSLCGYAYYPGGADVILMANNCATNGSTLPHEVGHFFSLRHTHGPSNSVLTTELVDGSNCDTDGDEICDTPADPKLSYTNVDASCIYSGIETDANGDTFVPDPNNIMSYSRKECRIYFSNQQFARIYATYKSVRNYFACPSLNVDFSANIPEDCASNLTVDFTDNSPGATSWQWDINSDNIIDYTIQNPSHTYSSGIYDVTLTVSDGTNSVTKTYFEYIKIGTQKSTPIEEDFENFDIANKDGWVANDVNGNGYNWIATNGGTPSANTGPEVDNTTGTASGTFIYTEASYAVTGDVAEYISPCINISSVNAELEFAYHMYGPNTGELHLDILTDSGEILDVMTPLVGQQQTAQTDNFILAKINLSAYYNQSVKIRFRAIRGGHWDGDIAIDDMRINTNLLSINKNELSGFKIYPNPVTDRTLNIKSTLNLNRVNYEVTNLLGQKVLSGTLKSKEVNVSKLHSGTYFLILKYEGKKSIKRFIIQ
ncbi:T9SS type A sorting domain-containing protein [Pontimicrobium aquaticum]|uniref:T9SS type A sorting domain-containing protein n=1 Tax=Pontimicrobium aquaticum TaxID=2565367 RepID=A0A4U0EPE0_9FLAO|nr:T9SS type A sorting domain-containing protein [Pontimicrobium aquaticum]TJY32202.1 T9SS type A sorting domain-containing protein [Pontimicrobium aquaticum]